jgi:hypothetical protein
VAASERYGDLGLSLISLMNLQALAVMSHSSYWCPAPSAKIEKDKITHLVRLYMGLDLLKCGEYSEIVAL